jgi:hypothetical protein
VGNYSWSVDVDVISVKVTASLVRAAEEELSIFCGVGTVVEDVCLVPNNLDLNSGPTLAVSPLVVLALSAACLFL